MTEINLDSGDATLGVTLSYFIGASNSKRVAKYNGYNSSYWTRTPDGYDSSRGRYRACYVQISGSEGAFSTNSTEGVRPIVPFSSDLFVMDDGTLTANQSPTAPASIAASNVMGGQQATVTLGAASDPDGTVINYVYERSIDTGMWTQFASTASLSIIDQISDDWDTVRYRAKAVDDKGVEGPYATSQTYTVIHNQPPTAPASITASNIMGGQQATVTLGAATDTDGQIINYTYERQVDGGSWTQFASENSLTVTDQIDDSWTTVTYRAKAMDDMGAEGPYATSEVYTVVHNQPPTAPGSIEVTNVITGQQATVTLTAATDPDGTVASYIYERQVDGGAWQQIANVNSLTQTDSILATWGTVAYRAKAVDNEGVSGPYATAAAETVTGGWILIGGPISNLGVQGGLFNLPLNIGVSGNTGVTGINLQVLQDGVQVYNNAVNQGDVINIPVDTRAMASGQHQIQAIADKDTFLAANVAWLFVVPSMALPDGGRIEQAQNADGEPIFFTTTTRAVIGPDGKSAQTQIDEINRSHQGITGHLAFVDAVMGPNASYVLARAATTTYAYQYYAPAAAGATGATLVSVYPGYNGAVGDLLTAAADTLTFNIPANGLLSIYQYNLDTTEPPDTDPTANFVTLDQPHVMTAATNTGNTADGLEDALTAMMRAFPSRNYYALNDAMDPDATYYVVSQAVIGPDTASATVAYVSSANPTTWYQGVQITLMNTSNIPALFDYISSPLVSAATTDNPVVAGVNLNATLATMIKAQPIYLRYQLESSTGVLYYVCSPTAITPETVSAINVLYCTASGTYYNGETLTLAPPTDPTPEVTE